MEVLAEPEMVDGGPLFGNNGCSMYISSLGGNKSFNCQFGSYRIEFAQQP